MKIVLISTGLGMGGAERQVCDLADRFDALGHQILLLSLTGNEVIRPLSKTVKVVSLGMSKTLFGFNKAYWRARYIINTFNPDVVHGHMIHANLFARFLRLTTHMPKLICSSHNSNEGGLGRVLASRLTDFLCDLNTNVSQEAVDISLHRGVTSAGRIIPMYNGIDINLFNYNSSSRDRIRSELGLSESASLLLAVGRLTAAKDYPNLFSAISLLRNELNNIHLAIVGIGEEHAALQQMVETYGLSSFVHFLGLRRDVNECMCAADVYVMSSAWEGMPLVLLEAMASERIVVATDCGGVKEVVGECGIIVSPQQPDQLAKALSQALSLPLDERISIGGAARKRVEEYYSLNAVVDKWLKLYTS